MEGLKQIQIMCGQGMDLQHNVNRVCVSNAAALHSTLPTVSLLERARTLY